MKVKICGLFRGDDVDYVNEAGVDFAGFVFAPSRRQLALAEAEKLRSRLVDGIVPVGVFVNAPITEIVALYRNGIISMAQLHGIEDEAYIAQLKRECEIPIIKTIIIDRSKFTLTHNPSPITHDLRPMTHDPPTTTYYLLDSGAGSGIAFDWESLDTSQIEKPWFLAGGINAGNIERAMALNPFAIDVSSGAETAGMKDREKILELAAKVKKGSVT